MLVCNNILLIIIINSYVLVFVLHSLQYAVTSLFECWGQICFLHVEHIVFTFLSMDLGHKKHLYLLSQLLKVLL
jgi:hypothetical protein